MDGRMSNAGQNVKFDFITIFCFLLIGNCNNIKKDTDCTMFKGVGLCAMDSIKKDCPSTCDCCGKYLFKHLESWLEMFITRKVDKEILLSLGNLVQRFVHHLKNIHKQT